MSKVQSDIEYVAQTIRNELTSDAKAIAPQIKSEIVPSPDRMSRGDFLDTVERNWNNAGFRQQLWESQGDQQFVNIAKQVTSRQMSRIPGNLQAQAGMGPQPPSLPLPAPTPAPAPPIPQLQTPPQIAGGPGVSPVAIPQGMSPAQLQAIAQSGGNQLSPDMIAQMAHGQGLP